MAWFQRNRGWKWAALILGLAWVSIGCSPGSLAFLLMPFVDDRVPAKCKLAQKDKEVTVAIVATFGQDVETRLEVASTARELSEHLIRHLQKHCAENKEKVKFVPAAQVVSYLNNQLDRRTVSMPQIGKHFKADFVVALEIDNMTLFDRGSQFFRGNAEIDVHVHDVSKPGGEARVWGEQYRVQFPNESQAGIETSGTSVPQFRSMFLSRVANDLARNFTAFPREVGMEADGNLR